MTNPSIIYGPIISRRLGRSLGINLFGNIGKVCNFNCIYCECGRTVIPFKKIDLKTLPLKDEVLTHLEKALRKPHSIDYITFSGIGEPTLHPQFAEITHGARRLRDTYKPNTKVAVFTNASTLDNENVVNALNTVDKAILKIDAWDDASFKAINQPGDSIDFSSILSGMKRIDRLIIQTLIFCGKNGNYLPDVINRIAELMQDLSPTEIQIYSLDREPWLAGIEKVNNLENIKCHLRKLLPGTAIN